MRFTVSSVVVLGLLIVGCGSGDEPSAGGASAVTDAGTSPGQGNGGGGDDGGLTSTGPSCGRLSTPCTDGKACEGAPDCASGLCLDGTCAAISPTDGRKDGDETDIDCGGTKAPACADGKGCTKAGDCTSGVCTGNVCQAPNDHDGVKNGDETGLDCGGATAPKCAPGIGCKAPLDCTSGVCTGDVCQVPNDHDGVKNGDETGADCGGPTTPNKCPPGQGCTATSDCANTLCNAGKTCDPPSKTDGLQNGTESDVDCGGGAPTNAPACATGLKCGQDGDCASVTCAYTNRCAPAPSCRQHEGGDTCGKLEVEDASHAHESCCTSLPLPGTSIKVDKYEITAGRMREFMRAVNNDVAGWVSTHRAQTTQIPDGLVQYLPSGLDAPTRTIKQCGDDGTGCKSVSQTFGVHDHLGNTVFMPDRPCPNCGQGCWVGTKTGENGHPTYWWSDNDQTQLFGAAKRQYSQAELDEKSLNCVTEVLLAAFCAWDGGRLPTANELGVLAWGSAAMPWGASPSYTTTNALGNADAAKQNYTFATGYQLVPMITGTNTRRLAAYDENTTNFNPFPESPSFYQARYVYPIPKNANGAVLSGTNDQAYGVAPPGRMRFDFRKIGAGADDGLYDLAANIMEATADYVACTADNQCDMGGACVCDNPNNCTTKHCVDDANHNAWPRVNWVGSSFEGHENRIGFNKSVFTKYGKQGGRCVRPQP